MHFNIETLISFASGILVPMLGFLYQHIRRKKRSKKKDIVSIHLDIQHKNQEILDDVRSEYNADRVNIVKFSNGNEFLDNTHILHLTMICESNSNAFENIKHDFQRLPAYLFDRVLNILKTKEFYVERSSENQLNDPVTALRKNYGVETAVGVKLYDKRGRWIGILHVEWGTDRIVENDEIAGLIVKSKQIQ